MLEGSIGDLKKIAASPSTPSHLLIELGKHKNSQIRSLIASNPNTPVETLKCLGQEFADAIVDNPVFELLILEDANSKFVRLTLARSTKTPPEVLAKLIATENSDFEICCAVANNINTPINALASLAIEIVNGTTDYIPSSVTNRLVDNWLYLAIRIIRNPNIPESCLEKVLDISIVRNHQELLWESVSIPKLSYQMLEKLSLYPAKHPDIQLEGCGCLLIDLPLVNQSPILLDNIARNTLPFDEDVFLKIAKNSITLTPTIEYIAAHDSRHVRNALIDHPNVSRKALDIILFMQGKPGTPVELLRELAENPRFKVLKKLCTYPNVPSEVLDIVNNNLSCRKIDEEYRWEVLTCLAYHSHSSDNLLQKIVEELELVSNLVSNGGQSYDYGINSDRRFIQKTNKLIGKINQRLNGEYLTETDKFYAYWAIAIEQKTIEDKYSWENLYQSDPQAKN